MAQLNIFDQQRKDRFKSFKDKFYAGVKERYEDERRAKQKNDSEAISIIHGVIPRPKYRVIKPKN